MKEQFDLFLRQSEKLRKGYQTSLSLADENWLEKLVSSVGQIPELLKIIYSKVSGTKYEVEDQKYMDFLPGFLLVHIDEYAKASEQLFNLLYTLKISGDFFPILRNYSSDFVAVKRDSNEIYRIFHDESEIFLIHKTPDDFLKTINAFYLDKVFFTDDDGYLDYDPDLQYQVARNHNPDIDFWND